MEDGDIKKFIAPTRLVKSIGILGGGQLGKMLIEYGLDPLLYDLNDEYTSFTDGVYRYENWKIDVYILDPSFDCPCAKLRYPKDDISYNEYVEIHYVQGSLHDENTLTKFCKKCDVVTFEIEHINTDALCKLEDEGQHFVPSPRILRVIQNKLEQKHHYASQNLPTVPFAQVNIDASESRKVLDRMFRVQHEQGSFSKKASDEHLKKLATKSRSELYPDIFGNLIWFKEPPKKSDNVAVVLKKIHGGYDGRGVTILRNSDENCAENFADFCGDSRQILAEDYIDSPTEISVLIARTRVRTKFLPDLTEEIPVYEHETKTVVWPVVEMVFDTDNNILDHSFSPSKLPAEIQQKAIDIAVKAVESFDTLLPSSKRSGKQIAEGVFAVEMFIARDSKGQLVPFVNEIAPRPHNSCHHTIHACEENESVYSVLAQILLDNVHKNIPSQIKTQTCAMKNILGPKDFKGGYRLDQSMNGFGVGRKEIVMYDKSITKPQRKLGHVTIVDESEKEGKADLAVANLKTVSDRIKVKPAFTKKIGIVMGSTSDWPIMKEARDFIKSFNETEFKSDEMIPFEATVVSAHRTPERLVEYAKTAADRDIGVIIAGAGGAAHLPGMLASVTHLPIIGVPIKSEKPFYNGVGGMDSLLSVVQMPAGVPVATVAVNGAKNAAILALQILGVSNDTVANALQKYKESLGDSVVENSFFIEN